MSNQTSKRHLRPKLYLWWRKIGGTFSWALIATAVVLTLALGFLGFAEPDGTPRPVTTRLYLAIQLFTLESGAFAEAPEVNWKLEVARWAGFIAAFGTLINTLLTVFAKQLHRLYRSRQSGHAVIIGAGSGCLQLATDLMKSGRRVCVIDKDSHSENLSALTSAGAVECIGDACDPSILSGAGIRKAAMVFILAGDDVTNLAIANSIGIACDASGDVHSIQAFIDISDPRLFLATCRNTQTVDFFRFSRIENGAREFFKVHNPDQGGISIDAPEQVHLIIIGRNSMARALINQALASMHYANGVNAALTLITDLAVKERQSMLCKMPEFELCAETHFYDGDTSTPDLRKVLSHAFHSPEQLVTVAICETDFERSLDAFQNIAPLIGRSRTKVVIQSHHSDDRRICVNFQEFPHIQTEVFGQSETSCSEEHVIGEALDELARRIHESYVVKRISNGDSPPNTPALLPWEDLPIEYKVMNRQQADHIAVKLRALNIDFVACDEPDSKWPRTITNGEFEALARAEHCRWAACKRVAGWRFGGERDDDLRIHPDLVSWSSLSEAVQEYDREPVQNLPKLLGSIGYQLINQEQ